ncbi:MAG: hypothetical protein JST54_12630 [Deltaproteobacteria bacterium]|nr:hypothetical protein [Deltaproteobacteria bacterium]
MVSEIDWLQEARQLFSTLPSMRVFDATPETPARLLREERSITIKAGGRTFCAVAADGDAFIGAEYSELKDRAPWDVHYLVKVQDTVLVVPATALSTFNRHWKMNDAGILADPITTFPVCMVYEERVA